MTDQAPTNSPSDGGQGSSDQSGAAGGPSTATSQQIQEMMQSFWQQQIADIEHGPLDFKFHQLPLARVKKVMKADEDAKTMMISAEAPMIFSKACEIFILELTMRSWIHTEEHKRRTLQKSDVATAISKADMYDFLIDIVPRDEINKPVMKDLPATYAYYQNPTQYLASLPPEQQQALLAYQLANPQGNQVGLQMIRQQQGGDEESSQAQAHHEEDVQHAQHQSQTSQEQQQQHHAQTDASTAEHQYYLQQLQSQMQALQQAHQAQQAQQAQQSHSDHQQQQQNQASQQHQIQPQG
ncbi:hypothetical protein SpCBS45565_g00326 [Spizellomyces sp. 'palustris']|nr:hypothetical protein SpCBS45565_g00326 [Spizellomyces sp. 'palustris']